MQLTAELREKYPFKHALQVVLEANLEVEPKAKPAGLIRKLKLNC